MTARPRLNASACRHRLLQVGDDVVRVLHADRQADDIVAGTRRLALLGVSWLCVVEAGWMTRLRVSPMLARCENSLTFETT